MGVCGSKMARVSLRSLADWKINAFAKTCLQGSLGAHRPAVYYNSSCIFDPEYPEASEEAEEEGLHPEWTLTEWGLSSGGLLQEDPELSEELFPGGFNIQGGKGNDDTEETAEN